MNHAKAIDVVHRQLLPDIRRGSDAAEVLLKYAKKNDLPAAQLEKLAQVVNTARTINYMGKSASRGDTFDLVDIPSLVDNYTSYKPAATVDADDWFGQSKQASVPNFVADALQEGAVKQAGESQPKPEKAVNRFTAYRNWSSSQDASADLKAKQAAADMVEDDALAVMNLEFEKLARQVFNDDPELFGEIEHDMLGIYGESAEIKKAMDKAAAFCANRRHPVRIKRASEVADNRRVVSDRHSLRPSFDRILKAINEQESAQEFVQEAKQATAAALAPALQAIEQAQSNRGNTAPIIEAAAVPPNSSNAANVVTDGGPDAEVEATKRLMALIGKSEAPAATRSSTGLGEAGYGLLSSGNRALGEAQGGIEDLIQAIAPAKNHRLEKREQAVDDVTRLTTLERLLADPIVSKANPALVTSLFNTVQRTAPHFANDLNTVKMVIRQALQYEGLTPDVVKTLGEIHHKDTQSRNTNSEMTKQRYALK